MNTLMSPEAFNSIGQIIQLSVAPAFLLVAAGSMINVATLRLGRVVDRARVLEQILTDDREATVKERHRKELVLLNQRMNSINRAIMFATFSALLVCVVVALLFLSALMKFNASLWLALLFVATMALMIIGLFFFLDEIFIATKSLKIHDEYLHD